MKSLNITVIDPQFITNPGFCEGKGTSGCVFRGTLNSTQVAIKKIRIPDSGKDDRIIQEISILNNIKHTNIIELKGAFLSNVNGTYYYNLVTTLVAGETLENLLFKKISRLRKILNNGVQQNLDIEIKNEIGKQICDAIAYLHHNQIIHGDIKPQNIMVDYNNVVKIIDFGFSKKLPPLRPIQNFEGTLNYAAPELIRKPHIQSLASDVWSLACVLKVLYSEKMFGLM